MIQGYKTMNAMCTDLIWSFDIQTFQALAGFQTMLHHLLVIINHL